MKKSIRTASLARLLAVLVFLQTSGCAVLIGGAVAGGAAGTVASVHDSHDESHGPLTYAGTVVANVGYFPAKVVFAGAGMVISGVAYVVTVGNTDTAGSIWDAAVRGDYVVTPRMIDGEQQVRFVG